MALSADALAAHLLPLLAGLVTVAGLIAAALWRRGAPSATTKAVIVVLAASLFTVLAAMPAAMVDWDRRLADAMRTHVTPPQLDAAFAITQLGNFQTLVAVGVIVALGLAARRCWSDLALWLAVTAGNGLLNRTLKLGFERLRPLHDHGLVFEPAFSFPSGHASGSLAVYGLLTALLLPRLPPAARLPLLLATVALVLLIGASRVILQVHFLSDVIAGYASATVLLVGGHALRESLRRRPW
ncbi:MAG: hypothetical protein C0434_09420 [Xanthomonadaceae bacterium]|nr:hypothetical protein [Xanthomonadaceae bacterium]